MPRHYVHSVRLNATGQQAFQLLTTPSHIRAWWEASYAVVIPGVDGIWLASWGDDEDAPDYVTAAHIDQWQPGHRLALDRYQYHAKTGPLPFEAEFYTDFVIQSDPGGGPNSPSSLLTVTQRGFPDAASADDYHAACKEGWQRTLDNMRQHTDRLTRNLLW